MNLTVDQMDVLNFRLTEISVELLGNQFFDICGRKCDTLGSLFRNKSGPTTDKFAANSDLVAALNVEDIFNFNDEPPEESHGDNVINYNYKSEEVCDESFYDPDEFDDELGYSYNREQNPLTDLKIAQITSDVDQEYRRLSMTSYSAKIKYFITNKHRLEMDYEDEYEICNRFHKQEAEELLGQSDAFIKLFKYIICDSRNSLKMGEIAATILKIRDRLIETSASRP